MHLNKKNFVWWQNSCPSSVSSSRPRPGMTQRSSTVPVYVPTVPSSAQEVWPNWRNPAEEYIFFKKNRGAIRSKLPQKFMSQRKGNISSSSITGILGDRLTMSNKRKTSDFDLPFETECHTLTCQPGTHSVARSDFNYQWSSCLSFPCLTQWSWAFKMKT